MLKTRGLENNIGVIFQTLHKAVLVIIHSTCNRLVLDCSNGISQHTFVLRNKKNVSKLFSKPTLFEAVAYKIPRNALAACIFTTTHP